MAIRALTGPEYRYSLDDAAQFLQYAREAVEYWLRTGHLSGRRDPRSGEWIITNRDLIAFIRTANEPMPTGSTGIGAARGRAATEQAATEVRQPVSISPN
ncbi:MAG: hypothetical protein DCC58_02705 [Chloroflexi bacterium]|nr:MAG: hypothetical protein DCC58_02705 [Chloroflexota bacterium]